MSLPLTVSVKGRRPARQQLRQHRRALSGSEQVRAELAMTRHLAASQLFQNARRVAIYWPADGEISPLKLAERAMAMGKRVYLPQLPKKPSQRMRFARFTSDITLRSNRFGIPEPQISYRQTVAVNQLDLVIVPVVAMDRFGNRMGMGGGYYDRVFANSAKRALQPLLLGVGHAFQLLDGVAAQPWDISLNWLATDRAVFPANGH